MDDLAKSVKDTIKAVKKKDVNPLAGTRRIETRSGTLYDIVIATGQWRRAGVPRKGLPANKKEARRSRRGLRYRTKDGRHFKVTKIDQDGIGRAVEVE